MKRTTSLLTGYIVFALGVIVALQYIDTNSSSFAAVKDRTASIVRLYSVTDGSFVCTGTVISATRILTAAHCVEVAVGQAAAEIRTKDGKRTGLYAFLAGANARGDVALLSGAFKQFAPLRIETGFLKVMANLARSSGDITACGFPYGGALLCVPITKRHMAAFQIGGKGFLYPGMSGGPVFDETTGSIVAVNTAVTETEVILSPLVELHAATETKP